MGRQTITATLKIPKGESSQIESFPKEWLEIDANNSLTSQKKDGKTPKEEK